MEWSFQVFRKEGFNIVIGNPPWEKTKFNKAEFFSKRIKR